MDSLITESLPSSDVIPPDALKSELLKQAIGDVLRIYADKYGLITLGMCRSYSSKLRFQELTESSIDSSEDSIGKIKQDFLKASTDLNYYIQLRKWETTRETGEYWIQLLKSLP